MKRTKIWSALQLACILAAGIFTAVTLSGCVAVGYSSRGGWFVWPGGLGLLLVVLLVLFLLRRRS